MRIGICDDNPQDCLALENILLELRSQDEVDCFTDSSSLLDAVRAGRDYVCLFLDILMPGVKGIELISQIEGVKKDKTPHVVFVTSSRDYAVEAFAYHAIHYLVKPVRREDVAEALRRIPDQPVLKPGITVKVGATSCFLYLEEIAVCESRDHSVLMVLNNGKSLSAGRVTLENLWQQLGENFIMLTRGLIVNMNYIEMMDAKSCILRDGRRILLSRKNLKKIHSAYDTFTFSQLIERGRD